MDANNTQWLVKPNNQEFKAYRWTGNRADLIHSPDWLRSLVNNWEFDECTSFRYSVKLFYDGGNHGRSITANPGDFILLSDERLIVVDDSAFKAIFMEGARTDLDNNKT